jgi:hypothetical protein
VGRQRHAAGVRMQCRQATRDTHRLCLTEQVVFFRMPSTTDAQGRQIDCVLEHFVDLGRPDVILCGPAFPTTTSTTQP